jgi:hypothetical protein
LGSKLSLSSRDGTSQATPGQALARQHPPMPLPRSGMAKWPVPENPARMLTMRGRRLAPGHPSSRQAGQMNSTAFNRFIAACEQNIKGTNLAFGYRKGYYCPVPVFRGRP